MSRDRRNPSLLAFQDQVRLLGELWVKHPIAMQGYFRDPEQTAAAFHDGSFKTDDLMRRDGDGYFYFVTRKKDIIRRCGENIAGLEIDRAIAEHPDVMEVATVPVCAPHLFDPRAVTG